MRRFWRSVVIFLFGGVVGTGFGVDMNGVMSSSHFGVISGAVGLRFYIYAGGLKANAVTEYQAEPILGR